mmetsp:Transcript_67115/g.185896  ORF Transcript_67115/g.185896 Transcript_67115/m.185896 type:complete len:295 (-) Transcript_67115:195-1079(-)
MALARTLAISMRPVPRGVVVKFTLVWFGLATAQGLGNIGRLVNDFALATVVAYQMDDPCGGDGSLLLHEVLKRGIRSIFAVAQAVGDAEGSRGVCVDGRIPGARREAGSEHLRCPLHSFPVELGDLRRGDGRAAVERVPELTRFQQVSYGHLVLFDVELAVRALGLVCLRQQIFHLEFQPQRLSKRQGRLKSPRVRRHHDVLDATDQTRGVLQPCGREARLLPAAVRKGRVVAHQVLVEAERLRWAVRVAAVFVSVPDDPDVLVAAEQARCRFIQKGSRHAAGRPGQSSHGDAK